MLQICCSENPEYSGRVTLDSPHIEINTTYLLTIKQVNYSTFFQQTQSPKCLYFFQIILNCIFYLNKEFSSDYNSKLRFSFYIFVLQLRVQS